MFVFFDFDGPLVDLFDDKSGLLVTNSILNISKKYDIDITKFLENPSFMYVWRDLRNLIDDSRYKISEFDQEIHSAIEEHELIEVNRIPFEQNTYNILRMARQHSSGIAIISNNSKKSVFQWLSLYNLTQYVDFISGRCADDPFEPLKPRPDFINSALEHFHCHPSKAIFIGDTMSDYISSQYSKVNFFWLLSHHSNIPNKHESHVKGNIFNTREELLDSLEFILPC